MTQRKIVARSRGKRPELLKEMKITNKMVAEWFNYASASSFCNSYCRDEMLKGVERVVKFVKNRVNTDINSKSKKSN